MSETWGKWIVLLVISVGFAVPLWVAINFIHKVKSRPQPVEIIALYPTTPAFIFCVDGATSLAYDHSTGPVIVLEDGYLLYETHESTVRINGDNCKIEWRK